MFQLIEEWISSVVEERTGEVPEESHVTLIFSLAVSLYCVGGMLGGCITGLVADKFGRKVKEAPFSHLCNLRNFSVKPVAFLQKAWK